MNEVYSEDAKFKNSVEIRVVKPTLEDLEKLYEKRNALETDFYNEIYDTAKQITEAKTATIKKQFADDLIAVVKNRDKKLGKTDFDIDIVERFLRQAIKRGEEIQNALEEK